MIFCTKNENIRLVNYIFANNKYYTTLVTPVSLRHQLLFHNAGNDVYNLNRLNEDDLRCAFATRQVLINYSLMATEMFRLSNKHHAILVDINIGTVDYYLVADNLSKEALHKIYHNNVIQIVNLGGFIESLINYDTNINLNGSSDQTIPLFTFSAKNNIRRLNG